MAEGTQTPSAPPKTGAPGPAAENPAVARCCEEYARIEREAKDQGKSNIYAGIYAARAFRKALPPLSGHQNICDFIACIAHGMLIGVISGADGARLLYAAQVANATVRSQPASPKSAA